MLCKKLLYLLGCIWTLKIIVSYVSQRSFEIIDELNVHIIARLHADSRSWAISIVEVEICVVCRPDVFSNVIGEGYFGLPFLIRPDLLRLTQWLVLIWQIKHRHASAFAGFATLFAAFTGSGYFAAFAGAGGGDGSNGSGRQYSDEMFG